MTLRVQLDKDMRRRVPAALVRALGRRLTRAAHRLGIDRDGLGTLAVRIVGDAQMAQLHERFMGEKRPTDVLSFPSDEEGELGDLVLDWDAVKRQSGPSPAEQLDEAVSLGVHGLAHLLGHDHGTRAQARAMLRIEARGARVAHLPQVIRPYGARR